MQFSAFSEPRAVRLWSAKSLYETKISNLRSAALLRAMCRCIYLLSKQKSQNARESAACAADLSHEDRAGQESFGQAPGLRLHGPPYGHEYAPRFAQAPV